MSVSRVVMIVDLLWKLPKVPRVVLVLVVDHMPVGLVGLNALRGRGGGAQKHIEGVKYLANDLINQSCELK